MTQDLTARGAGLVAIMNAGRMEVRAHARALLYGAKRRGLGPLPVTTPGRAETTEI